MRHAQPAPQAPNWNGANPGGNEGRRDWGSQRRDWGSQRQAESPRARRDGNNGGDVNQPAPAWQGQATAQGQNRWQQRNPAYSDPNRNRDHAANRGNDPRPDDARTHNEQNRPGNWQRDGNGWRNNDHGRPQQGWDGNRWNGQNWNRDNRGTDNRGNWEHNRGGSNWNRDWRRDNRYNWSGWRNQHRDVFQMGRYNSPYRDWSYRRLSIGFYLQSGFFGSNYLIDDPWDYRLPPAYGPYRWVRYYDDALLVNIYNGEVVDVLYDFFW